MMNLDTWNSLTEEQQQWVSETFTEVSDLMQESDAADLVTSRQACIDGGIEVYTLSDDEMAAFAPYMEKVNDNWIKTATDAGWDAQSAYDYVISAVEAAS
jgi:TRAP-type C4-dicarboxylate transport system substrate-binding protein